MERGSEYGGIRENRAKTIALASAKRPLRDDGEERARREIRNFYISDKRNLEACAAGAFGVIHGEDLRSESHDDEV